MFPTLFGSISAAHSAALLITQAALVALSLGGCERVPPGDPISPIRDGSGGVPGPKQVGPGDGGRTGSGGVPAGGGGAPVGTGGAGGAGTDAGGRGGSPSGTGGNDGGANPTADAGPAAPGLLPTGRRFGSHPTKYPPDVIRPTGDPAAIDGAVAAFYDKWKAAYLTKGCDGVYVKAMGGSNASSRITNSQVHGMAMLAVAIMAGHDAEARALFDGLFTVFRKVPSNLERRPNRAGNGNLMGYGINAMCGGLSDGDSQTDGDLPIALALLMADKQWGSASGRDYLGQAKLTLAAMKAFEMNPRSKAPLLGDWCSLAGESATFQNATHPADFAFDHFRAFATATGDMFWKEAIEAIYTLGASFQTRYSPLTGLFPEYVLNTNTEAVPAAAGFLNEPNANGFTSATVLSLVRYASDYAVSGDARGKLGLAKTNAWVRTATGGDPSRVVNGYSLTGVPFGAMPGPDFEAAFAAAAIVDTTNQAWLDALWKRLHDAPLTGFFADTVRLTSLIVVSGNYWIP